MGRPPDARSGGARLRSFRLEPGPHHCFAVTEFFTALPASSHSERRKSSMRLYLSRIHISLLTLGLIGLTAVPAPAAMRPFHLVEHGTLVPGPNGTIIANGSGNATHLGRITVERTLTLTPTSDPTEVDVDGEATLTAPG